MVDCEGMSRRRSDVVFNRKTVLELAGLLLVGVVLFLATGHPWLGVVLPSLRAGWRSLRTAAWVFAADPDRRRAVVGGVFCLALGCWKVAAMSATTVLVMVVVAKATGQLPRMERFAAVMITLTGGIVLTSLIGLLAAIGARAARIRLWIHPALPEILGDVLKGGDSGTMPPGFNHAIFVLITSLATPALASAGYILIQPGSVLRAMLVFGLMVVLVIVSYGFLARRIIADHPSQCWGRLRKAEDGDP